jgi:hypothetical protein
MDQDDVTRECPYCRESIKPEAVKCKHCGSSVAPEKLAHGGSCPYCKEEINPEAIKCKHCKSSLVNSSQTGCGCDSNVERGQAQAIRSDSPYMGSNPLLPSFTARRRAPHFANNIIVIGGPSDPFDPIHCMGFYECSDVCVPWLGCTKVCVWKCLVV